MNKKQILLKLLIIISILISLLLSYKISKFYQDKRKLNQIIQKFSNTHNIDFNQLISINNDTIGWLYILDTNINYPIVQSTNNDYYLNHSYDKNHNSYGWIFVDYRNNIDKLNNNTIIYGHSGQNSIFEELKSLYNNKYWITNNPTIILTTLNKVKYEFIVFSFYIIDNTNDYLHTNYDNKNQLNNYINKLSNRSDYDFNITNKSDYFLTISTCYDLKSKLVIHAFLKEKEV